MRTRIVIAALALLGTSAGIAQPPAAERGGTPPGTSRDGAAPAEGAIKGGAMKGAEPTGQAASKCLDLTGVLREQCLRQEAAAGAGRTAPTPAAPPSPREAPPPQQPR